MLRSSPGTTEAVKVTVDEKLIDVCGPRGGLAASDHRSDSRTNASTATPVRSDLHTKPAS